MEEKVYVVIYSDDDGVEEITAYGSEASAAAAIKARAGQEDPEDCPLRVLIFKGRRLFLSKGSQKYLIGTEENIPLFETSDPSKVEPSTDGWLVEE